MRKRVWLSIPLVIIIVALAAYLTSGYLTARKSIVIAVDEHDAFQSETASAIATGLIARGYTVQVRSLPVTAGKVAMVNDPNSDVTLALASSSLGTDDFPNVVSLGTIAALPLIPVVNASNAKDVKSIRDLKDHVVALDPPGSNRRELELEVLKLYGVAPEQIQERTFRQIEASDALVSGSIDAMFLATLDPTDALVAALATGAVRIVPTPEAQAMAGRLGTEYQWTLPQGGINIARNVPSQSESIIVSALRVIANVEMQDGAAYTIAQVLNDKFSQGTMFTSPGDFPWLDGVVPSHAAATDYYTNGDIPWQFKILPNVIADRFALLLLIGSIVLLIANLWGVFLPDAFDIWRDHVSPRLKA